MGPHGLHRMAYAEWGDADNPRVVLCAHGLTRNGRDFDDLAQVLADDFRVVWQGNNDGQTDAWNTWYRRTTDGGRTWSEPLRLSDTATTPAPYHSADGYRFPYGDYLELAVDGEGVNHVIWGEGLSYIGPGGSWSTSGR